MSYNFLIVHGNYTSLSSSLDDLVVEYEDVSMEPRPGPSVVIKVVDRDAKGAVMIGRSSP